MHPSSIPKWPNVPACYEWLSLDRRGDWRLRGERVTHAGLIDFLNRHYDHDADGRWFVQNGPQRVWVDLAATPWVYRRTGSDDFITHTGRPAGAIGQLLLDAEGNLFLVAEPGIGLLDDRDLPALLDQCTRTDGQPAGEADFAELLAGRNADIAWNGVPLQALTVDLEKSFKFIARPRPEN